MGEFRRRADDRAAPFLWEDPTILLYANEAEKEAAERANLLLDRATPSVCQVALVAGTREYVLDARVIDVVSARVRGQRHDMDRRGDVEVLSCYHAPGVSWMFATYDVGSAVHLVLDREPKDDGFLDLAVYRRPLNAMVELDDEPEINSGRHMELLHWMLYLAFDSRDSDADDKAKAQTNFDRFELAFGAKIDANVKRKQLRHRPPVTRPEY